MFSSSSSNIRNPHITVQLRRNHTRFLPRGKHRHILLLHQAVHTPQVLLGLPRPLLEHQRNLDSKPHISSRDRILHRVNHQLLHRTHITKPLQALYPHPNIPTLNSKDNHRHNRISKPCIISVSNHIRTAGNINTLSTVHTSLQLMYPCITTNLSFRNRMQPSSSFSYSAPAQAAPPTSNHYTTYQATQPQASPTTSVAQQASPSMTRSDSSYFTSPQQPQVATNIPMQHPIPSHPVAIDRMQATSPAPPVTSPTAASRRPLPMPSGSPPKPMRSRPESMPPPTSSFGPPNATSPTSPRAPPTAAFAKAQAVFAGGSSGFTVPQASAPSRSPSPPSGTPSGIGRRPLPMPAGAHGVTSPPPIPSGVAPSPRAQKSFSVDSSAGLNHNVRVRSTSPVKDPGSPRKAVGPLQSAFSPPPADLSGSSSQDARDAASGALGTTSARPSSTSGQKFVPLWKRNLPGYNAAAASGNSANAAGSMSPPAENAAQPSSSRVNDTPVTRRGIVAGAVSAFNQGVPSSPTKANGGSGRPLPSSPTKAPDVSQIVGSGSTPMQRARTQPDHPSERESESPTRSALRANSPSKIARSYTSTSQTGVDYEGGRLPTHVAARSPYAEQAAHPQSAHSASDSPRETRSRTASPAKVTFNLPDPSNSVEDGRTGRTPSPQYGILDMPRRHGTNVDLDDVRDGTQHGTDQRPQSMALRLAAMTLEGNHRQADQVSSHRRSPSRDTQSPAGWPTNLPPLPRAPSAVPASPQRHSPSRRQYIDLDDAPPPSLRRSPSPAPDWQKGSQTRDAPPVNRSPVIEMSHPVPQRPVVIQHIPGATPSPAPHTQQRRDPHRASIPKISFPGDPGSDSDDDLAAPRISVSGPDGPPSISVSISPPANSGSGPSAAPMISVSPPSISISRDDDFSSGPSISISGPDEPSISVSGPEDSASSRADRHRNLPPVVRPPPGALICGGCGGAIIGRIVNAIGVRWHPQCFKCCICSELLEHVSSYEHEGRPYCNLDYHEIFAPRCHHCKTPIVDERFITLDDPALGKRTYHEQHFFCAECGDPFLTPTIDHERAGGGLTVTGDGDFEDDDVGFTVYRGHPYCEACHVRLRLPKCKRCKKSIRDGARAVEALGGKWCWECFVCTGCERPFEDPSFFIRDTSSSRVNCDLAIIPGPSQWTIHIGGAYDCS
ncbi:hypothetical protein PUNSTDRAFT_126458 [Punctularia strigosozonata HHB-11173 SS5]|uniref:uncharacterized protein n=1 Tax=Punctularia strigosozonata (strain HHB-11173) TaxID=741275 RepID=UPI0004418110|nr:uncharacterized protein PUNSTDRAFT_126458 [Punctularia strigosozonata HHB-11173 SS5]EIN08397.1 hypothetical protein PUNSTDRAFT_126458 [Punctularia strigosozonata HHB-11173 SS5]